MVRLTISTLMAPPNNTMPSAARSGLPMVNESLMQLMKTAALRFHQR